MKTFALVLATAAVAYGDILPTDDRGYTLFEKLSAAGLDAIDADCRPLKGHQSADYCTALRNSECAGDVRCRLVPSGICPVMGDYSQRGPRTVNGNVWCTDDYCDPGYEDDFRGWYDTSGCGRCTSYCRWVGANGPGRDDPQNKNYASPGEWSCTEGQDYTPEGYYHNAGFDWAARRCSSKFGVPNGRKYPELFATDLSAKGALALVESAGALAYTVYAADGDALPDDRNDYVLMTGTPGTLPSPFASHYSDVLSIVSLGDAQACGNAPGKVVYPNAQLASLYSSSSTNSLTGNYELRYGDRIGISGGRQVIIGHGFPSSCTPVTPPGEIPRKDGPCAVGTVVVNGNKLVTTYTSEECASIGGTLGSSGGLQGVCHNPSGSESFTDECSYPLPAPGERITIGTTVVELSPACPDE